MGNEALCRVEIDDESADAKALLETEELIVRGALKARIPFRDAKNVSAEQGVLCLDWNARSVRIHVGKDAPKWAEKIRNPKSVAEKLGIRTGLKVSVIGEIGESFVEELAGRGVDVSRRLRRGSDLVFLAAGRREDLARLAGIRRALTSAGAVWVIRPKGVAAISESDVMREAKAAGLVDVKVVRFSATHTAEKLVIPVAAR